MPDLPCSELLGLRRKGEKGVDPPIGEGLDRLCRGVVTQVMSVAGFSPTYATIVERKRWRPAWSPGTPSDFPVRSRIARIGPVAYRS